MERMPPQWIKSPVNKAEGGGLFGRTLGGNVKGTNKDGAQHREKYPHLR